MELSLAVNASLVALSKFGALRLLYFRGIRVIDLGFWARSDILHGAF
jgi:hypothetical protein